MITRNCFREIDLKEEYQQLYVESKGYYLRNHPMATEIQCSAYAERVVKNKARKLYNYQELLELIEKGVSLQKVLIAHKSCYERMREIKSGDIYHSGLNNAILCSDSIIDIGCGLNPCLITTLHSHIKKYICYDKDKKIIDLLHRINNNYLDGKLTIVDDSNTIKRVIQTDRFDLLLAQKIIPSLFYNHTIKTVDLIASVKADRFLITGNQESLSRNISIKEEEEKALEWFIRRYGFSKIEYLETSAEFGWIIKK